MKIKHTKKQQKIILDALSKNQFNSHKHNSSIRNDSQHMCIAAYTNPIIRDSIPPQSALRPSSLQIRTKQSTSPLYFSMRDMTEFKIIILEAPFSRNLVLTTYISSHRPISSYFVRIRTQCSHKFGDSCIQECLFITE